MGCNWDLNIVVRKEILSSKEEAGMKPGFYRDISLICLGMLLLLIMLVVERIFDFYIFLIIAFILSFLVSFSINGYWNPTPLERLRRERYESLETLRRKKRD